MYCINNVALIYQGFITLIQHYEIKVIFMTPDFFSDYISIKCCPFKYNIELIWKFIENKKLLRFEPSKSFLLDEASWQKRVSHQVTLTERYRGTR